MAHGMQVFTSGGLLLLDVSDRITRIVGTYYGTANYPSPLGGSISVPGMTTDGTWLVLPGYVPNDSAYAVVRSGYFDWTLTTGMGTWGGPVTIPFTVLRT